MVAGIYTQDIINALKKKHPLFRQEIETGQKNIARQMRYEFIDQRLRLKSLLDEDLIAKW
jgi:hypothetical protein